MWDMILDGKMPWHRRAWFNSHPMIDIFKLIFCVSRVLFIILKKEVMVKYIRERERERESYLSPSQVSISNTTKKIRIFSFKLQKRGLYS